MIDRAYGCLLGGAIGDAMGMPASFMSPEQIKQVYGRIIDFLPPDKEQQKAHGGLAAGQVTDDTEESLILASVLTEARGFDPDLFAEKMRKWAVENRMLESTVIGPSTRRFLEALVNHTDFMEAGKTGNTNGGAMRVAPVGIFFHGDLDRTIQAAIDSARPSHGSRPGMASAAAVAAAVSTAVEGGCTAREVMEVAVRGAEAGEEQGHDIPAPSVKARILLAMELVDRNRDKPLEEICFILYQHIGASMKSYESIPLSLGVFYAAKGDYNQGLVAAINLGDDADTNGAIVGNLCGAFGGARKIDPAWIRTLSKTSPFDFKEMAGNLMAV
ncbi:ADP-ribosylglycohydrolase family protein [Desulfospira joergensenii]|uniref:ADP-ribosylglycohydrolase family protein n=1 Tax=Desulfospira joergensenii TaxID=53329 RepID=UPI0003B4E377|nr:ADP-ribosylglycohydrolase family protein [Desulfospira joergensenii]